MFSNFKRVTSSGRFIPEIDGLRFIAIISVVAFHLNESILKKNFNQYLDSKDDYAIFNYLLNNGDRGVPLFFAISGFILALPFANHYINGRPKVKIKDYFLRRVTRLEPPYIITMIGLFLLSIFIVKKLSFAQLFPGLLASLFYVNNIYNQDASHPFVNIVAWSLEIEIQFYILAPLFAMIFRYSHRVRRMVMLFFSIAPLLLHGLWKLPFLSILDYIQYFAVGFLLADLYASKFQLKLPRLISFSFGLLCLFAIWAYPAGYFLVPSLGISFDAALPLLMLGFYLMVLFTPGWKKILSLNLITTIGGMCYSIYLLHFAVISILGDQLFRKRMTSYYFVDLIISFTAVFAGILVVGGVFFLLIEKPCMQRDWPRKLSEKLFGRQNVKLQA